jgi:predicted small secreted protein
MNLFKTLIIALVVSAAGSLAACNTIDGAGKNVERTGEAVEKGADWARPNFGQRDGNASALPLRDGGQLQVVIRQQELQSIPNKPAATAEMP